ncbi:MAG: AEC family transporter [Clostridia bacterium]|nr:AEC family transporter [Clostridia bacterium]
MVQVFLYAVNAVVPILLLVLLGVVLRKLHFADDTFFKTANKLVFRVFLPVLLFCNIYEIDSLQDVNWNAVAYIAAAILALYAIGVLCARLFVPDRLQKGPIIQCIYRSNSAILGIPLAEALGGTQAVAFTAVATAVTVLMFNTLAVICLSHYADEQKPPLRQTLLRTITNPLIIGVMLGVAAVGVRMLLPKNAAGEAVFQFSRDCPFFFTALTTAAKAATPLALVVLGARFDFSAVHALRKQITLGVVMRLVFAPLFAIGGAVLLSKTGILPFTKVEYPALVGIFASPVAVSSAVMVSEIGGDDQLAAQLVVWTSVCSVLTIFLTVFLMRYFSIL